MARVLAQGSRRSAVRLAQPPAACEVLPLTRGFDAHDRYDHLTWLAEHQATIARRGCTTRRGDRQPTLVLSDVTRSSLEGQGNAFAAVGSHRAGKAGTKHVVIGLWCDAEGTPVAVEVWAGHTPDMTPVAAPSTQVARRLGGARVPCVGDRGRIQSPQMAALAQAGWHDIPAWTKPQVERRLKDQLLPLALCPAPGCAVEQAGLRDIVRRHPLRAEERAAVRCEKQRSMEQWVAKKNGSLAAPPRAQAAVALREGGTKLTRLKIAAWLTGEIEGRTLALRVEAEAQREAAKLAGCSVRTTDLPRAVAGTEGVQAREKDLTLGEQALRTCKTAHLEGRPVSVRTAASTRGPVLVGM